MPREREVKEERAFLFKNIYYVNLNIKEQRAGL